MTALARGANAPLPTGPVTVVVTAPAPVDVSALLVTTAGQVRSDADFVFWGNPHVPGCRVEGAAVFLDPAAIPGDVDRVVVVVSLDGPGNFAAAGAPTATCGDLIYTAGGLGLQTAILLVEVYRRGAGWKLRAVGQGYAEGLAGVATDHGVCLDEPTQPPAPPSPSSPPPVSLPAPAGSGCALPTPLLHPPARPSPSPASLPAPSGVPAPSTTVGSPAQPPPSRVGAMLPQPVVLTAHHDRGPRVIVGTLP